MKTPTTLSLALIALMGVCWQSQSASAGVMNGDFETPGISEDFAFWETDPGDAPPVAAFDGGGSRVARFNTTGFTDPIVQLDQTFTIPIGATTLSFEFTFSSVPGGIFDPIFAANDSFQATLFDSSGVPINPIDPFFLPGYYLFDSSGFEDKAATGVTVENLVGGVKRVNLDVSSLGSQQVTLDFQLLGDDDGLTSTVDLDNVVVGTTNVVPEPASLAIWACLGAAALPMCRYRRRGKMASAA